MKKILSIALLLTMILSLAIIPASAAERENVMTLDTAELWLEFGVTLKSNHIPEVLFDGVNTYNKEDSSSYCDFRLSDQKAVLDGTAMLYDIDAERLEESYIMVSLLNKNINENKKLDDIAANVP